MTSVPFDRVPGLKRLGWAFLCVFVLCSTTKRSSAEERTLSIYNIHTKEALTVTYKKDGKYVPEAMDQLNQMMRDWRRNLVIKMDPALIDLIWELHEELGSKEPVHLICGYRSVATNEMLRRTQGGQAQNSRHIVGQAADIVFPDVPLKQLRYSALIAERGGVGFYPASGYPFVHVDTGNVRHWPRVPRLELAVLFPKGHSLHIPADGRPLTPADAKAAPGRWTAAGNEMPWALTHKQAGPMLASLTPSDAPATVQPASLTVDPKTNGKVAEPQLAEEGEEQEDLISFDPLPATFLLAEKPLSYADAPDDEPRSPVFKKIGLLMSPESVLTSEEFDHRLQIEDLYEANIFRGPAIHFLQRQKSRMAAAPGPQATR